MAQYDEVYEKVSEMLCDAKDLEPGALTPDSPLHQLKLDSLDYVELMVLAKKEFGVSVEADLFINNPHISLRELCQYLSDHSQ